MLQRLVIVALALFSVGALAQGTPPTGSNAIDTVYSQPLQQEPIIVTGTVAVTDSEELHEPLNTYGVAELDFVNFTFGQSQLGWVQNLDTTDDICVKPVRRAVPFAAGTDTCEEVCDSSVGANMTCTAAPTVGTTEGIHIKPGASWPFFLAGPFCICAEATANTPKFQLVWYLR